MEHAPKNCLLFSETWMSPLQTLLPTLGKYNMYKQALIQQVEMLWSFVNATY
jgi:hypothetical protein